MRLREGGMGWEQREGWREEERKGGRGEGSDRERE